MQRRRLLFIVSVFCIGCACAFGLTETVDAAGLQVQTYARGSDFIFGNSATSFSASSGDILNQPPLKAADETVMSGQSDSLFGAGGGTYESTLAENSSEIAKSDTTQKVTLTPNKDLFPFRMHLRKRS
jgi:hypothetical protein